MVCEDPANTTLWARVHRSTYLDIQGDLLPLADDLKQLPLPFLDPAVVQPLSLPVVFASAPSTKAIQAAGIVTSYFGMISESRPVRFPVHIGETAAGNAIVISDSPSNLPAGLNMAVVDQPTIAMRTNPNDPFGKVLVIAGQDSEQTIRAAQAVAMNSSLLQGAQTTIDTLNLPARQPADGAPRWARTDQTVALWDYASADQLQNDGSTPLSVYFRLAPDIFYNERPNAVLRLAYRYNSIPIGPISSMQIRVNNAFLGSLPLVPGQEASRRMQLDVPVPVVNLRPFSNSLSFDFTFQLLKKSNCQDTTPVNMQGAILRDTYLDLRGYPHYAPMPNLEIFANAGFPFTRFADLAQTTVVLPPTPTEQEIEMFVTLMGHFGRQTGYPGAARHGGWPGRDAGPREYRLPGHRNRRRPARLRQDRQQSSRHSAQWEDPGARHRRIFRAPASCLVEGSVRRTLRVRRPDRLGHARRRHRRHRVALRYRAEPQHRRHPPQRFAHLRAVHEDIPVRPAGQRYTGIRFDAPGTRFQSFRVGAAVYHVGILPWWTRLTLWFMEVPWLAAVVVLALAFLLAIWTRQWLRQKARARLKMVER